MSTNMRFIEEQWSNDFVPTCISGSMTETLLRDLYNPDGDYALEWTERADSIALFFHDADRLKQVLLDLTPDRAFEILDEYEAVGNDPTFDRTMLDALVSNLQALVQSPSFDKFRTSDGISLLVDCT